MAVRWRGVVMVEGRPTGDGRYIEPGALRWDMANMPYPLTWSRQGGGHDDRVVVGSIDAIERDGPLIRGQGVLLTGDVPEAEQVMPLITEKLVGLSVELDDETSVHQPIDAEGNPVGEPMPDIGIMIGAAPAPPEDTPADTPASDGDVVDVQYRVQDARIRNAAIVDTPAFIECTIELAEQVAPDNPGIVAALRAAVAFQQRREPTPRPRTAVTAAAIGPHDTGTSDAPWDGPANEAKLTAPMPLARVKAAYAWYDGGAADADGNYPKTACRFIHHFVADNGTPGDASTSACSTGIGVLHGGRGGTSIPDADVGGVYNHLAGHMKAAGMEPPALSAVLTGGYCEACRAGRCDVTRTYEVPEAVQVEARRFQEWHRKAHRGGTAAAAARATTLARGGTLDYAQLRRLYLAQARLEPHMTDVGWESGDPGFPSPGRVGWAAGGGMPGWEWARRIVEELEGPVLTWQALTAAGVPPPPAAWFRDPQLQGPTPWTVTDDGRVYGHLATWDTCHVGVAGTCQTPPHSSPGLPYFNDGGPFRLDDGSTIRAGKVTFGTNHADKALSYGATVEHYEHTGHVAADVVAGEDRYGIWVAGALRPGLTDNERLAIQRASISGDWRGVTGHYELSAALLVNRPGFPVVESMVASGQPRTLILAGTVEAELAARGRDHAAHDPRLETAAEALAETIGRDRRSLVAAMSAEVHG